MARRTIKADWDAIREDYERGMSLRDIAEKHGPNGPSLTTLSRKAQGWKRRASVEQEVENGINRAAANLALIASPRVQAEVLDAIAMANINHDVAHRYAPDAYELLQAAKTRCMTAMNDPMTSLEDIAILLREVVQGHATMRTAIEGHKPPQLQVAVVNHGRHDDEQDGPPKPMAPTPMPQALIDAHARIVEE